MKPGMTRLSAWLSVLVVAAVILTVFSPLLLPGKEGVEYPWGSDTLGHVMKAEYLQAEIEKGNIFPKMFPFWYNGHLLFRYYPPLPYYLLVAINFLANDMVTASFWFIAASAIFAGLSFLLFSRWTGWIPALAAGILFALAPDNLRVALSEGNLPRVLATALLPALVYFFVLVLTGSGGKRHFVAASLMILLVILSHAMMGAIFGASLVFVAFLYLLIGQSRFRPVAFSIGSIMAGVLMSAFWLLPSLTGGISSLDKSAVNEALAVFSLGTYMNPLLRLSQPEIVYPGMAMVAFAILGLALLRKVRKPLPLSFFVAGMITVLISTPVLNPIFSGLPASQLFWPIRFLSFSSLAICLFLAFCFSALRYVRHQWLLVILLIAVFTLDSLPSVTTLVHKRAIDWKILKATEILRANQGWYAATLDYSRLGSTPAYLITSHAHREQVFGWAYQGACTAQTVAALNGALETSHWGFVLQLLDILAADDLFILQGDHRLKGLLDRLPDQGFQKAWAESSLAVYHRDGRPRALIVSPKALGIGEGASNFASLYPGLLLGSSSYLDDYSLDYLRQFPFLIISRFDWRNRVQAEELIMAYAAHGGQVLVDLNGAPNDPLAREPRFMNIYGERVQFYPAPVLVTIDGISRKLSPFDENPWVAVVPQGDLKQLATFEYLGVAGTALGYQEFGSGKIWYVGINLPYHALLTHDPQAIRILDEVIPLEIGKIDQLSAISLINFQADQAGYSFRYSLDNSALLLVPVSGCDGMNVYIDGQKVENNSVYRLVSFNAPAGTHSVDIIFEPTGEFSTGAVISTAAVLFVFFGLAYLKGKKDEGI